MPTEAPGTFRCKTWYPIWLYGIDNYSLYYLTSSESISAIFRTRTTTTIYDNYIEMRERMDQRLLTATGEIRGCIEAGTEMPTEAPGTFRCKTWYPIWLNGIDNYSLYVCMISSMCLG
jgi:uncharacterized protein YjlB